ncbi:hypothetical protein [Aquimarina sp. 2304DJ70-9]
MKKLKDFKSSEIDIKTIYGGNSDCLNVLQEQTADEVGGDDDEY